MQSPRYRGHGHHCLFTLLQYCTEAGVHLLIYLEMLIIPVELFRSGSLHTELSLFQLLAICYGNTLIFIFYTY